MDSAVMDPELWGTLQYHINLAEDVYRRLPLLEFFQLREVCKDWNRLAEPQRRPYFVIAHPVTVPFVPYHVGILTLHVASGLWKWNQLPFKSNQLTPLCQTFSTKDIVVGAFTYGLFRICYVNGRRYINSIRVPVDATEMEQCRALGMAVDTSITPHTFKLILGGPQTNTLIYDSARSDHWEMKSSHMLTIPSKRWAIKSCINCGNDVYIWSQMNTILVYSLTEDMWSTLDPPLQASERDKVGGALGYWDGRVFLVMADERLSLAVWELMSRSEQRWKKFACIPVTMQSWLISQCDEDRTMFASFCDEHVLMHTLLGKKTKRTGIGKNIVLVNLATKRWEATQVGSYGVVEGSRWN